MMRRAFLVLLLVGWTTAATHVNITIAQQPATNPADVSYVDGRAPAELRAGPFRADESDQEQRFERLQERSQQQQQQQQQQQPQQPQTSQVSPQQSLSPRQGLGLQPPPAPHNGRLPRRRGHSRRPLPQQPLNPHSGQFRQRNQQLRQNQEFERYIQSYHSHGPTVETVFETSSPSPQRYTQSKSQSSLSSSDDSAPQKIVSIGGPRSQQLRMFERQVASPVASQSGSEQAQDSKPIYEPPPPPAPAPAQPAPAVSGSSSSSSSASSSSSGSPPPAAAPQPVEPATSYANFNYDDGQDVDYQDQYAPEVEDGQGYDDYNDQSYYAGGSGSGYLPPPPSRSYVPPPAPLPQRPLVTKTIQIVQPALKAKKYEVRHPAIQKEFYDIEERVVIKPAGTLVVELDRPVAKIPRGETLLPLGHPHPAVASAYNNNGNIQTQSYNNNANEYRPSYEVAAAPAKDQQSTTIGSSVTTMPSYDQGPKDEYVESQLQQQQPVAGGSDATDGRLPPSVSTVDSNGNSFKINTKNLTPNMISRAEPEQDYSRVPPNEANYERTAPPPPPPPPPPQPQRGYQQRTNYNRPAYNTDDYFSGEFLANANIANVESKPARLELEPVKVQEEPRPRPQIIKHEHKIHLPPSQHNIYLGRQAQTPPKERRITEVPAHVAELKPYLRNHVGSTVVYAKAAVRPAPVSRTYYPQASSRQRSPLAEELEYSAPYSQMRFSPEDQQQSSRLVESPKQSSPKTHIQIKIPNQNEGEKSVVVASTISPDCDRRQQQPERSSRLQQSQRLVEAPAPASEVPAATQATPTPAQPQPDVDVALNGAAGHLQPNERVIAATPAPTDAAATSETFHKRRIVVNHPFQTVREVVEHEPITNYHQIQVNEPASPALYHQAAYYQQPIQTHGNLVQFQSTSTHGNLYANYR